MEDKKDIIVEADEIQANSSNAEPLAKRIYTMKAFQSSYQPETITWDSVGDKVNYNANGAITSDQWVRQGIYLCSSDQFGGPGFFLTDYDGFYDLPAYGSMFFKAVMCKLGLKVMVPPYSTFLAVINIDRTVYKEGDGDSSAWLPGNVTNVIQSVRIIAKLMEDGPAFRLRMGIIHIWVDRIKLMRCAHVYIRRGQSVIGIRKKK